MTYQKQIDKLEAENKDLRKQLLLKEVKNGKKPRWKVQIQGFPLNAFWNTFLFKQCERLNMHTRVVLQLLSEIFHHITFYKFSTSFIQETDSPSDKFFKTYLISLHSMVKIRFEHAQLGLHVEKLYILPLRIEK